MPGTHHTAHHPKSPWEELQWSLSRRWLMGWSLLPTPLALLHSGCVSPMLKEACREGGCPEVRGPGEVPLSIFYWSFRLHWAPPRVSFSMPFHPVHGPTLLLPPPPSLMVCPFLLQKGSSGMAAQTSHRSHSSVPAPEEARVCQMSRPFLSLWAGIWPLWRKPPGELLMYPSQIPVSV